MLVAFSHILLLSLIPVATTTIGAVVAVLHPPGPRVRSGIQHFAAGVVFSVVAVELLPDVVRGHAIGAVTFGFACGIAVMLLLRRLTDTNDNADPGLTATERSAAGMLVAVGIDVLLDGLLLGIAFAAGAKEGVLLAVALSIELLSLGVAMTTSLLERGTASGRAVMVVVAISLALVAGAVIGDTILHNASVVMLGGVLSFGCAALLLLVTEELLVEAHEVQETGWATAMFFVGFLLFLVLGMAA